MNWLGDFENHPIDISVKVRSTHNAIDGEIKLLPNHQAEVFLKYPERAITPGQACVIYDGERVLGGGWITEQIS